MSKYTLDVSREEIIEIYVKEWVLNWCKKNHPQVFDKSKAYITENLK